MLSDRLEQQLPVDAVKVACDVDIEHPVVWPAALASRPDGLDRRAARAISVGVAMEHGLQDRLQVPLDHFLGDSVGDRRYPERPLTRAPVLRDDHPSDRWRKIAPRGHSVPQLVEVAR